MKLNKIKRICLESKRFNIIDSTDGVQWFTDDRSMTGGQHHERKTMQRV